MSAEPCEFCNSPLTGPIAQTPHGICEACACSKCRGFRRYDDRGFLYTGSWPSLFFADCEGCNAEGTRAAQSEPSSGQESKP